MLSFVVVAAKGRDLDELPILRDKYIAGFLRGAVGSWGVRARADATTSDAAPPAADMLSLATWVTGLALFPRGQVPPYHDLLDWG